MFIVVADAIALDQELALCAAAALSISAPQALKELDRCDQIGSADPPL
jgi:hypothetical protein